MLPLHHLPSRNPQQDLHLLPRIRGYRRTTPNPRSIYINIYITIHPPLPPKRLLLPTRPHPTHPHPHLPPPNLPTNLLRSLPPPPTHKQPHILVLPWSPRNNHLLLTLPILQQNEPCPARPSLPHPPLHATILPRR